MPAARRVVVVVGGGASGYFAAVSAARAGANVVCLEKTGKPLKKVLASGGGRCNLMHAQKPVEELVQGYPRGHLELRGPLSAGFPQEKTRKWFEDEGVELKVESDGRVFPVTDNSETVAGCLRRAATAAGVNVVLGCDVNDVQPPCTAEGRNTFFVQFSSRGASLAGGEEINARSAAGRGPCRALAASAVILATGSAPRGYALAAALGHETCNPYPSLFSLRVPKHKVIKSDLAGVSVADAELSFEVPTTAKNIKQRGALLITHRGLSGPAALRLSSFAAAEMNESRYRGVIRLNLLPALSKKNPHLACLAELSAFSKAHPAAKVVAGQRGALRPFADIIPRRLWNSVVANIMSSEHEAAASTMRWASLSRALTSKLADNLTSMIIPMDGKDTNKEEFVTAGGVALSEVRQVESLHVT